MLAAAMAEASGAGAAVLVLASVALVLLSSALVLLSFALVLAAAGLAEAEDAGDFALPDKGWEETVGELDAALALAAGDSGAVLLSFALSFFGDDFGAAEAVWTGAAA
jgi:hypothetical protein